jgi:hypothetical protein
LIDSPLFDLLRRTNPSDKEISASLYRRMARHCTDVGGSHLGANDDAGIAAIARALASGEHLPERQGQVAALVAPVRGSGYYQILDGDQRLAHAAFRGETSALVRIRRMPVTTPLQELLLQMSWLRGRKELYQPIDAPELRQGWTTVRRCTDRLEKMLALLADRKVAGSYLDVASCYGWFVAEMGKAGYDAYGVERDPLAIPLGRAAYGLRDDQIATGDALELLSSSSRTWDVVSCFSLLHHYVLDRRLPSPEELFKVLDRVTAKVLFIDMGQEHEEWLRRSLRGWNERSIAEFLRLHGTFTEVLDLGPDDDSRPPYAANYGRHLFACVRG